MHFPRVRLHSSCTWLLHRDVTKGRREHAAYWPNNRHQHCWHDERYTYTSTTWQVLVITRKQAESPAVSSGYCMQWTLCQYYHHRQPCCLGWWGASSEANCGAEIPKLLNWTEEADSRLVLHVEWAVRVKQCQRVVVLSNDTDTFALLLHYAPHLQTQGLKELWQQYGTGERRRILPLHQAVSQLGAPLANTVIKAHILTGDDCMSKVGTKHAAMTCDPVQYLTNFRHIVGNNHAAMPCDPVQYLTNFRHIVRPRCSTSREVHVLGTCLGRGQVNHNCSYIQPVEGRTKYQLQGWNWCSSPYKQRHKRTYPPRSLSWQQRSRLLATYNERQARLEPVEHEWEAHFGTLLPYKCMKRLPQNVVAIYRCACKCELCDTQRCGCCSAGVTCVMFCHGKKDNSSCINLPRKV